MSNEYELSEALYKHLVLEGSAYEAGRLQAEAHRSSGHLAFCLQPYEYDAGRFGYASLAEMQSALERFCPGINEEIQGFADALNIPVEKAFYYNFSSQALHGCSHFAVHPSYTRDGQPLVGRSYEMGPDEEDRCLVTTRIAGRAMSVGFSTIILGRVDGVNEYGLSATLSAAITPPQIETAKGFAFWVFMRAVLDTCHSVAEALDLLAEMPLVAYHIFILADAAGDGALIETAGTQRAIRRLDPPEQPFIAAAQHFTLPGMAAHNLDRNLDFSVPRLNGITTCLKAALPTVSEDDIKGILATESPNGSYCPYYKRFNIGTLWSEVLLPAQRSIHLTFGSLTHNAWRSFGVDDGGPGVHDYQAILATKRE